MRIAGGAEPVLVNPVGFHPDAGKWCTCAGSAPGEYEVIDERGARIHSGQWQVVTGDTGTYHVACLPQLKSSGMYELRAAGRPRARIVLRQRIYDEAILKCVSYFAKQRCGDGAGGYNAHAIWTTAFEATRAQRMTLAVGGMMHATSANG